MFITSQLIDFINFIVIGITISVIFDFFRAYRKQKSVTITGVIIQDIIYFCIATIIVSVSIIVFLDCDIRLYVFIGIIIGIFIYISIFSKYIMKLYTFLINVCSAITDIFFMPIRLMMEVLKVICNILNKIVKKCCKKFFNMLSFICSKSKLCRKSFNIFNIAKKRGLKKNEKKHTDDKKE